MGNGSSGVLGPTLFLLLLLMILPLLSVGNFQYRLPGWVDFHHLSEDWKNLHRHITPNKASFHYRRSQGESSHTNQKTDKSSCQSAYDLYFVLDMSGSVDNNWMSIYSLVYGLVKKFENPKVRISFILYSTFGQILMKLTSDKKKIAEGLHKLQNVVPTGTANMHEGLKKANYQITEATNEGKKQIHSMILVLTDGTLDPIPLQESKEEAAKARKMGASVYGLGIKDYESDQLVAIADSKHNVLGVNRFQDLRSIIDPLTEKICIEITHVEASSYCAEENYELTVSGKGFKNAEKREDIFCRFKFSDVEFIDRKATSMDASTIVCPGVKIRKPDQSIFILISLDNGTSFIDSNVNITSKHCVSPRHGLPVPGFPVDVRADVPLDLLNRPRLGLDVPGLSQPSFFSPLNIAIFAALLFFLLFVFCSCGRCCGKTIKDTVQIQVPDPQKSIMFVPCCGCQGGKCKKKKCCSKCCKSSCLPPCCRSYCYQPQAQYMSNCCTVGY